MRKLATFCLASLVGAALLVTRAEAALKPGEWLYQQETKIGCDCTTYSDECTCRVSPN